MYVLSSYRGPQSIFFVNNITGKWKRLDIVLTFLVQLYTRSLGRVDERSNVAEAIGVYARRNLSDGKARTPSTARYAGYDFATLITRVFRIKYTYQQRVNDRTETDAEKKMRLRTENERTDGKKCRVMIGYAAVYSGQITRSGYRYHTYVVVVVIGIPEKTRARLHKQRPCGGGRNFLRLAVTMARRRYRLWYARFAVLRSGTNSGTVVHRPEVV